MTWSKCTALALVGLGLTIAASPALALPQRTFVASYGSDTNPCSLAQPCRGFTAAITAVTPGGEVIVKDSAGYGTVTITQSVSIIVPAGIYAGISIPALGTGVTVNAANVKVVLRGLTINGQASSTYGVWLQSGAELVIDRCIIANNKTAGVYVTAPGSVLTIKDSQIRFTTLGQGVRLNSDVRAILERVSVLRSVASIGIWADAAAALTINDSLIAGNSGGGVLLSGTGGVPASVTIADSVLSDNNQHAIKVQAQVSAGSVGIGNVADSLLTRHVNGQGLLVSSNPPGVAVASAKGNLVSQNGNGMGTGGTGQSLSVRDNTFSRNGNFALANSATSTIHSVKGADGLPGNAGEQAVPTSGAITPTDPF